jgi:thymidylate kinase
MMLKHTSLMELVLLARYWKEVQQEIKWLLESESIDDTLNFVNCWLPSLDAGLFSDCIAALKSPTPLFRRIILGHQLRSQLRLYARHSALRAWLSGIKKFAIMFFHRLTRSKLGMIPQSGGAVIAFVGSEATGKTTLLAEIKGWLGDHFTVEQIHAGKPKSTILSVLPNLLVPALRAMLPTSRSTHVEAQYDSAEPSKPSPAGYPLIFTIRSALLAYDRRSLLTRAFGRAANGTIVLCDRYPSLVSGAPDSPQLSHLAVPTGRYSVRRLLARIESRLYREIPPPDLIIYLSAPLEVTVLRNATRGKKEPEEYVRRRHARSSNLEFGKTPTYKINTDQPLDQTILEVKRAIWNAL